MKKYLWLLFSLFSSQNINAVDPRNSEDVQMFCALMSPYIYFTNQFFGKETDEFLKKPWDKQIEQAKEYIEPSVLDALHRSREGIISNDHIGQVPFKLRQFFPKKQSEVLFKELRPRNGGEKILAIGSGVDEIDGISLRYHLNKVEFYTINVLLLDKPHCVANMYDIAHMKHFENSFSVAFARAVPFEEDKMAVALSNIANSLKENGVLILGRCMLQVSFKQLVALAKQAKFLSVIKLEKADLYLFSRAQMSSEELLNKVNADSTLRAIKDYSASLVGNRS